MSVMCNIILKIKNNMKQNKTKKKILYFKRKKKNYSFYLFKGKKYPTFHFETKKNLQKFCLFLFFLNYENKSNEKTLEL